MILIIALLKIYYYNALTNVNVFKVNYTKIIIMFNIYKKKEIKIQKN
jgi:hypothetical protein